MSRRMNPVEKLARDICWAGFSNPTTVGCSKAEYWEGCAAAAKDDYRREARHLSWLLQQLGRKRVEAILAEPSP